MLKKDRQQTKPETDRQNEYQVDLDEHEHPQQKSLFEKWVIVVVISSSSLCVTCASSVAAFAEDGMAKEFHVAKIVTILSINLFVERLGFWPVLVGPLSEGVLEGTSYIRASFLPGAVFLIFRFITGFCGSTFLSVAGGSVSDLFANNEVGTFINQVGRRLLASDVVLTSCTLRMYPGDGPFG
ncbi:hypothetical protein MPER_06621, partial [Moniliophthora perniciosa FA553]